MGDDLGLRKPVTTALRELMRDFEWVHVLLGVAGNACFVVGSVFFLWPSLKTAGVWLFIVGSLGMFIGAAGRAFIKAENW